MSDDKNLTGPTDPQGRDHETNRSGSYGTPENRPGTGSAGEHTEDARSDLPGTGSDQHTTEFPTSGESWSHEGHGSQQHGSQAASAGQAYQQQGGYQTQYPGYPQHGGYQGGQYQGVQQHQYNQPYQQQSGYPQYGQGPHGEQEPGFFKALFDMSFTHFVTEKFVKVIYILAIIFGVLVGLTYVGLGFVMMIGGAAVESSSPYGSSSGSAAAGLGMGLFMIVIGLILMIIYIVMTRVTLEFILAMIRTAKNTGKLVERQR